MKTHRQTDSHTRYWRKTSLALAVLAALPGTTVPAAFAAVVVPAGPPPHPVGPEFQVNTYTTDEQSNPIVAIDAAGDFVNPCFHSDFPLYI